MRDLLLLITGICSLTAAGYALLSLWCAERFFSSKKKGSEEFLPPISILKSVRGVDEGMADNLASFCRQDYPQYQILLGVRDPQDPAVALIRQLQQQFPERDLQLILCDQASMMNPKISNLVQMEKQAQHPFVLVSDGDIRVDTNYLRRLVQPMREPEVGAITCMCRSLSKGWIGTLEALREVTEFCPNVLVANQLEGIRFGLGSAILVRKQALERIGGLASVADHLADDYLLGNRIARAGYKVLLSDLVVEHELSLNRWRDLIQRQIRWNRGIRTCRPVGYRGLLLTYGIPMSLFFLLLSGFSVIGWSLLAVTWTARLATATLVGGGYLKDRAAQRYLWLIPIQDLLSFGLWCVGLFGNHIHWRGQSFRLTPEGKLEPPGQPPSAVPINSALARPLVPLFIRFKISANQVTILSLLSGVLGGVGFSFGTPHWMFMGAMGFLLANLLDECDGKVARLTHTASQLGAFLDTVADCIVHVALFLGLGVGLHHQFPQGPFLLLGAVAAGGSFLSFLLDVTGMTPWQAPSSSGSEKGHPLAWVVEWLRIDFSLLVLCSAFWGHLSWVVWAGALGVFFFWIPSTVMITVRSRRSHR